MEWVTLISTWIIPIIIGGILFLGTMKRVPTYETFVEGAKEGFGLAVSIIPYLVGMLVAISVFRLQVQWICLFPGYSLFLAFSVFLQKLSPLPDQAYFRHRSVRNDQ